MGKIESISLVKVCVLVEIESDINQNCGSYYLVYINLPTSQT